MATVYKKPNSRFWYAQFYGHDGKRVSRSTGKEKKREAEKAASDMESDERKLADLPKTGKKLAGVLESAVRDGNAGELTLARATELLERLKRIANPDFREISLKDYWKEWRGEQAVHIGDSTAQGYEDDEAMFAAALGARAMSAPIAELKPDKIKVALTKASKGRRGSTVNKALASLRRVLESAVVKGLIPANPAKLVRTLPQDDSAEKGPFDIAEVRAMLGVAPTDEWIGAITIASQTGLRRGDLMLLSKDHVEKMRFVIRPSKTKRTRKTITVPISPPVFTWIDGREGKFFPKLSKMSASKFAMQFDAITKKAGVPKQITVAGGVVLSRSFHSLRHTFASWLAAADVHADVRQKLTGHSSSKIHQRYTHHDEALDRAVKTLPNF